MSAPSVTMCGQTFYGYSTPQEVTDAIQASDIQITISPPLARSRSFEYLLDKKYSIPLEGKKEPFTKRDIIYGIGQGIVEIWRPENVLTREMPRSLKIAYNLCRLSTVYFIFELVVFRKIL
jgi:hypothetical protein